MHTGKLLAGIALVFVVGALIGSLGTRFYFRHQYRPFTRERGGRTAFIMKRLATDLRLAENQQPAVEKIVVQTEEKLRQYFLRRRSEIVSILDDAFAQIKKELDDDQKKNLDALREKFEKHRRMRGERQ